MVHLHIETPVHQNAAINNRLNKNIYLKMDCYQPSGSFKLRGIGALCQHALESGKQTIVSSSGGNAGYSAAYAARQLGLDAVVVMPENAPETARERIRGEGAEVIVKGAVWDEADAYARQLADERNGAYIHPFDNAVVWTGHSTLIDEAVKQCPQPDVVVVSVGGGGLMVGVVEGMQRHGWTDVPVLAIETEGAASFGESIRTGQHVKLERITSIAHTLGALKVTPKAIEWAQQHPITPVQVTDASAVNACLRFADDMRVVVEPACGASLSLIYDNVHHLDGYQNVLVIVCGGAGVMMEQLLRWSREV